MKKSYSLRTQLFALMALLVLLQSLALVSALAISRVFLMLDAEAFRLFDRATSTRAQSYNQSVGDLVSNMSEASRSLSVELAAIATNSQVSPGQLYEDDEAHLQATSAGTASLIEMLRTNTVSGAFLLLDGSNANKGDESRHSGVYLRNLAAGSPSEDTSNYFLEIGPISVSQKYKITSSVNWELDLALSENDKASDYYTQPIWAAKEYPNAETKRYGFWSPPTDVLGDRQSVILYTMPLLAEDGSAFGILGIEISLTLFNQHYLPNTDLPYQNSFYAIASVGGGAIDLGWFIPSGPMAETYLTAGGSLPLQDMERASVYQTEIQTLGEMYCSVQPLSMYSRNSPFYDESWSLVGFVPTWVLHETSAGVRTILITSIIVTTVGAFVALFVMVFLTTRKIHGLSKYVKSLSPYMDIHFTRTGIREIDDLTGAVERLNQSVVNASQTTSKILKLTLLPIGGFEVSIETSYVILTEFVYELIDEAPGTPMTKEHWADIYSRLIKSPAVGYEHIYRYERGEYSRWLRILETKMDTGTVGVILDVTKDIEEHRRLAHELDYDALTHLYNRTAFKREAHNLIQSRPDSIGAMIFSDLDNLKYINDTFGHDMGDRLIIRAGEMFREFERHGGIVSRISGDEFAVYLHGFANKDEARRLIADQYCVNERYTLNTSDGSSQRIRSSSGIAFYPEDSDNVTDLIKLSDYAMYEAKHSRKGSMIEFNMDSYKENAYLLENREAINRLLDEKLIRFAFQPIVDLRTGEIYAYEALMRPLLDNFKSPLEILSVAAAQSKLGQLERVVILTAFGAVADMRERLGDVKVLINSIPSQLVSAEDLLYIERTYADIFKNIVIEITEAENDSPDKMQCKVDLIQKWDMGLAIDDFGSGYSNEIRILSMSPDVVKVDIALISMIDREPDKQKLVANLVSFCHPKGIKLIAEGVERREELAQLIKMDVDFVQGYYLARPDFELKTIDYKLKKEIQYLRGQNQ